MKNEILDGLKLRLSGLPLDELLENISVVEEYENSVSHAMMQDGWVAVVSDEGIIAYMSSLSEALRYRLDVINQILNC